MTAILSSLMLCTVATMNYFGADGEAPPVVHAVVVGAEYTEKYSHCSGCTLDANNMETILTQRNIKVTKLLNNMTNVDYVRYFVRQESKNCDLFVFFYSGHGGQASTATGPEEDDRDEYMCLNDGPYLDDNFYSDIENNCSGRIFCIFDCCHSQTMFRNPSPITMRKFTTTARNKRQSKNGASVRDTHYVTDAKSWIVWSGCPDNTVSYGSSSGGYLTNGFRTYLDDSKSYHEIWLRIEADETIKQYQAVQQTLLGPSSAQNSFDWRLIFK